jgi:hypothetical protein
MDDQLRRRIHEMARQLVAEEKQTFRGARTLLDLENLTVEIGDELVRQLANTDLAARSDEAVAKAEHACPECARMSAVEADREPLILQGRRGELEYSEPRCHCRSCRRDFFPSGPRTSTSGA